MKTTTTKLWAAPEEIARNEKQPRLYFAADELERLGESLKRKQQQPVTVIPFSDAKRPKVRWKIVDGERRWRAAKAARLARLWIVVDDDVSTEQELHTASFAANWCRAGHTHAETALAIDKQREAGLTYDEIAAIVGKTAGWASNEHSLLQLDPEVLRLVDAPTPKADRIPTKLAYALVKFPQEKQMRIWKKNRHRPSSEAFHHIRVSAGTRSRSADDVQYIIGRASSILSMAKGLANLPAAMLNRMNSSQREKVAGALREAAEKSNQTAELITAATEDDEEQALNTHNHSQP